ncbi:MAG: transglutaminase domain-containing protein, partial [Clostridia bacterium]|nr:transglutaminase domain-containing protein [Clostridia bacterium]
MNNKPRTLKERILALDRSLPAGALIGALLGSGLALPLHAALGFTGPALQVPLLCAAFALALAVLSVNRWTRWIGFVAALAAVALWALPRIDSLQNVYPALSMLLDGYTAPLRLFSAPLTVLFCATFTLTGFSLARRSGGFYPALSLTLVLLLGIWFYGDRSQIVLCLPALLALMLLYAFAAEHGTALRRIFPMALAAILLAMLLLPGQQAAYKPLEDLAHRLRERISDYLFFTEPRTSYSLQTEGFQPMGERLGGPAEPSDRPVMEVRSGGALLLRGTIRDSYTGLSWYDGASGRRYLYIDPRFGSLRDNLFDARRPDAGIRRDSALFGGQPVEVAMVAPGVSTIFMPQRYADLHPNPDMVPYFNASSEIFITRDTAPGDAYTVTAYAFTADTPGVAELVAALRGHETDPNYEAIQARYLDLPVTVEPGVRAMAEQWTEGAHTPFEKAMALTRNLRAAFPYTLAQNIPPASRDFVSWFLLEEKKGYCTSFASSLAVMGRLMGLPTRYIEGYAAQPGSDGIARVTGKNAHAWVEIYFEHFGWVPFDATPPEDPNRTPPHQGQNGEPPPPGNDGQQPPPSTPPPENTPEPTPGPSPSPEERPGGED